MIGIQNMGDTNTIVPDWFDCVNNSGLLWMILVGEFLLVIILVALVCRYYYELKEIDKFLDEHNGIDKD